MRKERGDEMRIIVLGEVERRKDFLNFQGKGIVFFPDGKHEKSGTFLVCTSVFLSVF